MFQRSVCDWKALAWTTKPNHKVNEPKRIKKNTEIFPLPDWQAVHFNPVKADAVESAVKTGPAISVLSVFNAMIFLTVISIIIVGSFL
jgi:hypothetical protein